MTQVKRKPPLPALMSRQGVVFDIAGDVTVSQSDSSPILISLTGV